MLPFSVPSGQPPRKWYSIAKKSAKEGELLIYDDIGAGFFTEGVTAAQFTKDLHALGKLDELSIRISSYGGDVSDGLAIYRVLAGYAAHKTVHIDSVAASIASVIAMAGDEIMISEPAQIMIHDAWGFAMGNARDLRAYADHLQTTSEQLAKVYIDRTGNKTQAVRDWMEAETWFTSAQAVENGFASVVEENVKAVASASPAYNVTLHRYRNIPQALLSKSVVINSDRPALFAATEKLRARRDAIRLRAVRDRAK